MRKRKKHSLFRIQVSIRYRQRGPDQDLSSNSGGCGGSVTGTLWLPTGREAYLFCSSGVASTKWGGAATRKRRRKTSVVSGKGVPDGGAVVVSCRKRKIQKKVAGVTENSDGQDGMAGGGADTWGKCRGRESFITVRTNAIGMS